MAQITSRQNARIKAAAGLRTRKAREAQGLTLVHGPRETARAIQSGARPTEAFWCPEWGRGEAVRVAIGLLRGAGGTLHEATADAFERLAYGDRRDGFACVLRTERRSLAGLSVGPRPVVAVVEGVEKPGNLGAILRSADGAGVDAVIAADPVIDLFGPNVIRASVGAVFKPNVAVGGTAEVLRWVRCLGAPVFATRPDACIGYASVDYSGGAVLLFGAEATGLSDAWRSVGATPIGLPMLGVADSLNLSATAAVLFYETLRQRAEGS